MRFVVIALLVIGQGLLGSSCAEKTPDRGYIPVIKDRLFLIQEAFRARNNLSLDSLVSDDLKEDTVLFRGVVKLIYGEDGRFAFERFGDCEIMYDDNAARADCFSVDRAGKQGRSLIVTLARRGKSWVLKNIQMGQKGSSAPDSPSATK